MRDIAVTLEFSGPSELMSPDVNCHEHVIHDGIQKFQQIPAAAVSPHAKLETKPPIQTNDSQF